MKKNILIYLSFLLLLLFLNTKIIAQQKTIDSLITSLKSDKADSNKLKKLVKIGGNLVYSDPVTAENYLKQALKLSENVYNNYWKAWTLFSLGTIEERKGNFPLALGYTHKADSIFELIHQKLLSARCEYALGTDNLYIGNYNEGLKYLQKSEKKLLELNNILEASNAMVPKASIYAALGQFDTQINELEKCEKIKKEIADSSGLSAVYIELSIPLMHQNKIDKAEEAIFKGLAILKIMPNPFYLKSAYGNLGYIEKCRKHYDKSLEFYTECLNLSLQFEDKKAISTTYNKMAEIAYIQGNKETVIQLADKALILAKENGDLLEQKNSYQNLSNGYELSKNTEKALYYFKQFKTLEDSVLNENNNRILKEMQTKYYTEQKDKENQLLQAKNEVSTQTIQQQKIVTYFIIGGLLIVSGLAFFIFKGLKKQRTANKIISLQKQEVERQKTAVEEQKQRVEEHQKEILDSIHYAKRIQTALLPNEKYIKRKINELNKK